MRKHKTDARAPPDDYLWNASDADALDLRAFHHFADTAAEGIYARCGRRRWPERR